MVITTHADHNGTDTRADQLVRPDWLTHDRWPFVLRRYDHPGADSEQRAVHYTDEGRGPVLVFVHAGMWSFIWRDVLRELRDDFRCISLDFPGAGLSEGGRHDVDLAGFPAIVNGLLDHLDIEKATFVVHDLGGVVGVTAAAAVPDRAAGLVATNSFAWRPDGRALRLMLGIVGSRVATATLGTVGLVPRVSRSTSGVGRHMDRADRAAFFGPYRRSRASRNFHRAMRSARRSCELFDGAEAGLRTELADLPLLTVFGENNDPFGFEDRWVSLFPAAQRWVVPDGNHFPMCDDPSGYARRLRQWHADEIG